MITCILVSHNKEEYLKEAIDSVLTQRFQDWKLIIIDSGILFDKNYFSWINDERVKIIRSTETRELQKRKAMAPWCFNQCLKTIDSKLVVYLCDDDILYENAFETFFEFYKSTAANAMYASQDIAIHQDGFRCMVGERRAIGIGGRCCNGRKMDCQVDSGQICHTVSLLKKMKNWWPEEKEYEQHADGVFMERIGDLVPFYPIDIKVSQNRRTPISTYKPSGKK